ncbi:MAG: efflux RND transporter permease subunit [Myxococcota bacterium]
MALGPSAAVAAALLVAVATGCERAAAPPPAATREETVRHCTTTVAVVVRFPGASASVVEELVTIPIERVLASVDGIQEIASTTREAHVEVRVEVQPDRDVAAVLESIRRAVGEQATLPEGADAPQISRAHGMPYFVVSRSEEALGGASGPLGVPIVAILIEAAPARLYANGLTVGALETVLRDAVPRLDTLEDLRTLIVSTTSDGNAVQLQDVASIRTEQEGPIALRGETRVYAGFMPEAPSTDGAIVEVVEPGFCGTPALVTVTARPPEGLSRAAVEDLARRLSHQSPDALVLAQLDRLELTATATATPLRVASRLVETLRSEPGVTVTALDGVPSARTLELSHVDLVALSRGVEVILDAAEGEQGVIAIGASDSGAAQAQIEVDDAATARFGLTLLDVTSQLRGQVDAIELGQIQGREFGAVVRLGPAKASKELSALMLRNAAGEAVPLASVATVTVSQHPGAIERHDMRRTTRIVTLGPSSLDAATRLAEVARRSVPGLIVTLR